MWDKAREMLHLEITHHKDRPQQIKRGCKFCSGKGIHQEDTSPGAICLSKLKLELKNVISTHTKAPAFLLGRKKTKKRLRQRSPESPPSLALKITCILPLGSPNHDQGGRH